MPRRLRRKDYWPQLTDALMSPGRTSLVGPAGVDALTTDVIFIFPKGSCHQRWGLMDLQLSRFWWVKDLV
jgi:hypothetical protein